MEYYKLGFVESRFADIIWSHEPLASRELVAICQQELNWKKPTTYTVLRKLCERGFFQNEGGLVTSLLSREEFYSLQSRQFVDDAFDGSLPAFLAAFTRKKALSPEEIAQIEAMISTHKEDCL